MNSLKKFAPLAVAVALVLAAAPVARVLAQDVTVLAETYFDGKGLLKSQTGGVPAFNVRTRFTIAQVNAGATILPARTGYKYRLIDAYMISVGGATATCTTVDIVATQSASGVKLVANAVAALTQSALLRAGASNSTILADGASFVLNDVSTAVTIGKTGSSCATATHIDVQVTYSLEAA